MKIFASVLLGLVALISLTATTDAQAYWHGYRGGWRGPGWRGPGWGGCYRCGPGWVGGAVIASSAVATEEVVAGSTSPQVVVEQAAPAVYAQQSGPVVLAPGPVPPSSYSIPPIGSTFSNLFPGCVLEPRNGINFYQCQGFRMRPLYNGNNFYYRVVPG